MSSETDDKDILAHVVLPVAHEEDALATATALEPYGPTQVTALHVIEGPDGMPAKTPVEQSDSIAADSYAAVRSVFPDADEHTAYGEDVATEIFETVDKVDASAIAYRSRGGNRLLQFLSGDISLKLVTNAICPVIALPVEDET
jgi:nucleotide-binding universal stress UspA family protein